LCRAGINPALRGCERPEANAIMAGELLRSFRCAVLGEIGWTCAGDEPDASDPRRHQRRVRQHPDPHRYIEPLLDQIDHAIDEEQPGGDLRESVEEPNHDGHDMQAAEHGWCSDGNLAARLTMLTGKGELRSLELGENAAARFKIMTARFGER